VPEQALDLTRKAATVLQERGFENPRLEAELLLAGVLRMRRLDLYLQHDRPVGGAELQQYREAVRRRLKHEPLQYILGTASFRRLELKVDGRVLIPRPETEVLVGAVLDWANARAWQGAVWGGLLDIGTGSAAIALSLALEGQFGRVVATDISPAALEVARENAAAAGLGGGVEFRCGPLFEPVSDDERFSVIVSNPPYVAEAERAGLAAEVRDHEPALALFGGATGLDVIADLIAVAPRYMETGALLAIEIGAGQGDAVLQLMRQAAGYSSERILPDLTGRPRIATAERSAE
jgi:release factor glutamine methyltransferase